MRTQGKWVPEAAGASLQNDPPYEQANQMVVQLMEAAKSNQDAVLLDSLLAVLKEVKLKDEALARKAAVVSVEGLISRAIVETNVAAMRRFLTAADGRLKELEAGGRIEWGEKQVRELRGKLYLAEAQKLVTLAGAGEALPAIMRAKNHYLAALPVDAKGCLERLKKIGVLLEHIQEWEVALAMYREIADGFAHTREGRDMLLKSAKLYEQRLNYPMAALDVYAEYAARYPAELSYDQLALGRRLERFGYVNVLDFQKRMGLKPDGIAGRQTRQKLAELEAGFDMISIRGAKDAGVLRGEFIHPAVFRIGGQLERAGRHYDAIKAYLLVLNLFPSKREADDALLRAARLFRGNMLFEEALGAYEELEEDTWMVASTRSADEDTIIILSPEKRRALDAIQRQKFNKDDIDEFKMKEYVGENNRGFLEIRSLEELEEKADDKRRELLEILFADNLPANQLLLFFRIVEAVESVSDRIEDAADLIRILAVKSK